MNLNYAILTGSIDNILENVDMPHLSGADCIRIRNINTTAFKYHAVPQHKLNSENHYLINLDKDKELKILSLIAIGMDLFDAANLVCNIFNKE